MRAGSSWSIPPPLTGVHRRNCRGGGGDSHREKEYRSEVSNPLAERQVNGTDYRKGDEPALVPCTQDGGRRRQVAAEYNEDPTTRGAEYCVAAS